MLAWAPYPCSESLRIFGLLDADLAGEGHEPDAQVIACVVAQPDLRGVAAAVDREADRNRAVLVRRVAEPDLANHHVPGVVERAPLAEHRVDRHERVRADRRLQAQAFRV